LDKVLSINVNECKKGSVID